MKIASNPITHEDIFIPSFLTTVDALDAPEAPQPTDILYHRNLPQYLIRH